MTKEEHLKHQQSEAETGPFEEARSSIRQEEEIETKI